MSEFKAITTQEELDLVIGERLKRQEEVLIKKYADYEEIKGKNASLENELAEMRSEIEKSSANTGTLEKTIEELTGKVRSYELSSLRTRYAMENGIPYDLAGRIAGEDEESIQKDAQSLAEFFKSQSPPPPLRNTEPKGDVMDAAYKNILKGLKGE
ncbi:MAG: DUF4355 domain-containing protein [Peptostreptococcaceae bacterium]|nr:DUF4355 domain-containing protein [Peptostreptococcaceae bacterium]